MYLVASPVFLLWAETVQRLMLRGLFSLSVIVQNILIKKIPCAKIPWQE